MSGSFGEVLADEAADRAEQEASDDARVTARREQLAMAYAGRFYAETMGCEPPRPLEPTDANLAALLCTPGIIRSARPEEFDDIRAAFEQLVAEHAASDATIGARINALRIAAAVVAEQAARQDCRPLTGYVFTLRQVRENSVTVWDTNREDAERELRAAILAGDHESGFEITEQTVEFDYEIPEGEG